jgi:hypothetical protein
MGYIRKPKHPPSELSKHVNSMASRVPQQLTENVVASNEDVGLADAPSELLVDELWDDFFTVGSTFDDTNCDVFFFDIGANMS